MGRDWIKMRVNLREDPHVIGIAGAVGICEDEVVGKLLRVWGWISDNSTDGNAPGVTESWLDCNVGVTAFAQAMVDVGWLLVSDEGLTFPDFETYLSQGAKRRALTAKRAADYRQKSNAPSVTKSAPEKKRVEKKRVSRKTPCSPPGNVPLTAIDLTAIPGEVSGKLDTPKFRQAWTLWIQHRKELGPRQALKPTQARSQLKMLAKLGPDAAIAMIEHTIEKGWVGLRAPDQKGGTDGRSQTNRGPGSSRA